MFDYVFILRLLSGSPEDAGITDSTTGSQRIYETAFLRQFTQTADKFQR